MQKGEFTEGVAAVDEEAASGDDRASESFQRPRLSMWVSTVQRANSYREREVIALLVRCEHEFFARHVADAEDTGGDQITR